MMNRQLARGLFLAAVALAFGGGALQQPLGTLGRAGPGLFPLMMSGALLVIAVITIVRSWFEAGQAFEFRFKNIGTILIGLSAFAVLSEFINMAVGIAALVFITTYAASSYSWKRNVKVALGLMLVALAFKKLLGLNLPLY